MKSLENPLSTKKPTKRLFGSQPEAEFSRSEKTEEETSGLMFQYADLKFDEPSYKVIQLIEKGLEKNFDSEVFRKYPAVSCKTDESGSFQELIYPGEITAQKLAELFQLLKLTRIEKLSISVSGFNDRSARQIADFITSHPLEQLNLDAEMTQDQATIIANAIPKSSLKKITYTGDYEVLKKIQLNK